MKLTDFLDNVGRPIAYYPSMRKLTGSTTATILLCQFIYWRGKEADQDGWLYKTSEEIETETGLSYNEQKTARRDLVEAGLLQEHYARLDHQMKFRLDINAINAKWGTLQGDIPESDKVTFGNDGLQFSLNSNTETTTETTTNGGLSEKDMEQVNAKVDAIIDAARTAKYQYREKFPPNLVPLVDCYVEVTGQTPSKRVLFDWIGSFGEMYDEGITPEHLRAAYKHATRPDGGFLVSRPGSLTNTASAIKAQGGRKTDEKRGDYTRQLWEG